MIIHTTKPGRYCCPRKEKTTPVTSSCCGLGNKVGARVQIIKHCGELFEHLIRSRLILHLAFGLCSTCLSLLSYPDLTRWVRKDVSFWTASPSRIRSVTCHLWKKWSSTLMYGRNSHLPVKKGFYSYPTSHPHLTRVCAYVLWWPISQSHGE